ncbi:AAA family ATPase [Flavobacteriaceae bacterium F08102]|nr:AAA family ATPase [Flavobacteriaceae bacterium F08102]
MITSLNIKNIATYDAINGVPINDLKRVNFFFGFNGSGKSTIGKYLHNLSLEANNQNPDFNQCSQVGYDETLHQILTFNEDFIERNFVNNSDLKGVFSLNQSNAIIDQQIKAEEDNLEGFKKQIDKYKAKIEAINADKGTKQTNLVNHCWNQRKTFDSFTKVRLVHSGSRSNHLTEVKRLLQNPLGTISTINDLTERYQRLYEKDLKEIQTSVDAKVYWELRKLEEKINNLLQEVIVGNEDVNISGLIQTLNSRNWVEQGLDYIESSGSTCPFCQQETINVELKEQFSKFFDETYKEKIAELERLKALYREKANVFISNISKIQNEFNPQNKVSNLVIALTALFDDNVDVISYKIEHSNEKKLIISLNTQKAALSEIIKLIKDNNQLFSDLDANKETLLSDIWKYMANNCQDEIDDFADREAKYNRIKQLAGQLIGYYDDKITKAKRNIESLRNQTADTKEAVDYINDILKNAGFESFEIAEKDKVNNISRYYLKRPHSQDNEPIFKTLSEGEKNFISFLYFYRLCLGTDDLQSNGNKKKIIVIDDPVSSLDSQALFIITTLIRELIQRKGNNKPDKKTFLNQNISQVFILTHNFYFHKEVSIENRICTDFFHFNLQKSNNVTSISGQYNRRIKDDYSLLWSTLKEIKENNLQKNNANNIFISNTMRRIIESYVNFIGLGTDSWSALLNEDKDSPNYYIKCAFMSTINDESHKVSVLDGLYYQKIINEQPQVLFDVFRSVFETIGIEHYKMMMDEQIEA